MFIEFVKITLQILVVHSTMTYGQTCGQSKYLSHTGECCPMCNIGLVVYRDCAGDFSTTCKPCFKGTYMNEPNGLTDCFPCKPCDGGLYVAQSCTTISNTVCDVKDGYYCREYSNNQCTLAIKHKKCDQGQEIIFPGNKNMDIVCKDCPHGYFSPHGVTCTKWTDCSVKNEIQEKDGSSVQDVQCKPNPRHHYLALEAAGAFLLLLVVLLLKTFIKRHLWDKTKNATDKKPVEETSPDTNLPEENKEEDTT